MIRHNADGPPCSYELKHTICCVTDARRQALGQASAERMPLIIEATSFRPQLSLRQ
jgi:hypothetical protein